MPLPPDGPGGAHTSPPTCEITTVGASIDALSPYPPETVLHLALQPGYSVGVGRVVCTPDDADTDADADAGTDRGNPTAHERMVWISEGARTAMRRSSPGTRCATRGRRPRLPALPFREQHRMCDEGRSLVCVDGAPPEPVPEPGSEVGAAATSR